MQYLEKGSEKSFHRFCTALINNNQSHLVNVMNDSATKQQQAGSANESRPVLQGNTSIERTPVSCTESTPDQSKTLPVKSAVESTQGFTLYFIILPLLKEVIMFLCLCVSLLPG